MRCANHVRRIFVHTAITALTLLLAACGANWSKLTGNSRAAAPQPQAALMSKSFAASPSRPDRPSRYERVIWLPSLALKPTADAVATTCLSAVTAEFGVAEESLRGVVLSDVAAPGCDDTSLLPDRRFYELRPVLGAAGDDECGSKIYVGALEPRKNGGATARSLLRIVDNGARHCDDRPGGTIEVTEIDGDPKLARTYSGSW